MNRFKLVLVAMGAVAAYAACALELTSSASAAPATESALPTSAAEGVF
jgi:hypothetical protein